MPRFEKCCYDWSLTWSPEVDCQQLPEFMAAFAAHSDVRKVIAIAERHGVGDKWHIHMGFRYHRSYNSDYKWYKPAFELAGFSAPALHIVGHDNLMGLAGGYLTKGEESDRVLLYRKGFTNEELEYGKRCYIQGLSGKRIKKFLQGYNVVHRGKFECAIAATMSEDQCDEGSAVVALAEKGFAFADSIKGLTAVYKELYDERKKMGLLKVD